MSLKFLNKKKIPWAVFGVALFGLLANVSFAAISYDSSSGGTVNPSTSLTFTHTVTGSNTVLICSLLSNNTVTGITFNGDALTQIKKLFDNSTWYNYLYGMIDPDAGAHNVVVSNSQSTVIFASCASYAGVDTATFPDSSNSSVGGTGGFVTTYTTTTVANGWLVTGIAGEDGGVTAGTSTTSRDIRSAQEGIGDSNGSVGSAGSHNLTWFKGGTANTEAMTILALAPYVSSTPSSTPSSTSALEFVTEECVVNGSSTECYNLKDMFVVYLVDFLFVLGTILIVILIIYVLKN